MKAIAGRWSSIDQRTLRRALMLAVIALCIGITIALVHSSALQMKARGDDGVTQGWRSTANALPNAPPNANIDTVVNQWGMRREKSAETSSLSWNVSDLGDLRASLLALDSLALKLQKVSVTKRETGFAINAELSP
jgi:hypothetical protein